MSGIWHIKTDAVGCEVEADSLDEACAKFATAERLKAQSAYGLAEEMEKLGGQLFVHDPQGALVLHLK